MAKPKTTKVTVAVYLEVEIRDSLLKSVLTDEWRDHMYNFHTPGQVAEHLAFNYVKNRIERVTELDGFADRNDNEVTITVGDIEER